jgi:hypothetical protein
MAAKDPIQSKRLTHTEFRLVHTRLSQENVRIAYRVLLGCSQSAVGRANRRSRQSVHQSVTRFWSHYVAAKQLAREPMETSEGVRWSAHIKRVLRPPRATRTAK